MVNEDLVFINSIPLLINPPNPEDYDIYSPDLETAYKSAPGKIIHHISEMLFDLLEKEKLKGKGVEVADLAKSIDEAIEKESQKLIADNSDYFILKEFHSYVYINRDHANIVFINQFSGGKHYERDHESILRVQETTRRVIDTLFFNDKRLRELYAKEGEAVLYLYSYNVINKKTPIGVYFHDISYKDWLAKFGKTPEDYHNFFADSPQSDHYFIDLDKLNLANADLFTPDAIVDDIVDDIIDDYEDYIDSLDEDDYEDDDDEDDDESDLPQLPWN
ncbi:MAG: hypothetical protein IKR19_07475 [Acholeplasmatales bacterium]|nr:hypothetical protein [Acholeplasmatales bacterium]